jgi:beta-lactamase regulating signal transducer with metallopeptidase domain
MMPALTLPNALAYALQVAAIVLAGVALPRLLRLTSPRARLQYFRGLLVACFLLPLLQPWRPVAPAGVGVSVVAPASRPWDAGWSRAVEPDNTTVPAPSRGLPLPLGQAAAVVAGLGIIGRLAWLGLGLRGLARLRATAPVLSARSDAVTEAQALVGVEADLRASSEVRAPVTFGIRDPVVLLPGEFATFALDHQRAIVCHEFLHIRRGDWRTTVVEEVVRSMAWFHPGVWILIDQIQLAREQVVDEQVVELMGTRDPYLDALLHLVAPAPQPRLLPAALFLRKSHLAQRIALLLKEGPMSGRRVRCAGYLHTLGIPSSVPVTSTCRTAARAQPVIDPCPARR